MRGTTTILSVALLVATGCSFIYDGGEFARADARVPPPDVNPTALTLDSLNPSSLDEGSGCIPEGDGCADLGRAVPVVITGSNISMTATITLDGGGFNNQTVVPTIASDGSMAAFSVRVPVMPNLAAGETVDITVKVAQAGIDKSLPMTIRGLPEFVASVDAADGTYDVGMIQPRYSTVNFDTPVAFEGADPARFIASSEILVSAKLSADGGAADVTTPGTAGPGGCSGGASGQAGQCGESGGRGAAENGGGGGGGGSIGGDPGAGGAGVGGDGGMPAGNPTLTPLTGQGSVPSRGHGGGGGGKAALLAELGAGGGGGGGVIELSSDGRFVLGSAGELSAVGGQGGRQGNGAGCVLGEKGGAGGGGSGGAILIRAHAVLTDDVGETRVAVDGGVGGQPGGSCSHGGNGAPGRVRVDVPSDAALPGFTTGLPALYRGPVLDPATPLVVPTTPVDITFFGDAGTDYWVQSDGGGAQMKQISGGHSTTVSVPLQTGLNTICAAVAQSASQPEGRNCLTIAYIDSGQ